MTRRGIWKHFLNALERNSRLHLREPGREIFMRKNFYYHFAKCPSSGVSIKSGEVHLCRWMYTSAQHSLTFAFSIATAFAAERANRLTVADHPTRYPGRALAGSQASRSRARAPADRIGCRDCNRSRVGMARRWHIRRVVRVSSNWSVARLRAFLQWESRIGRVARQRLRLLKGIPQQTTAS